MQSGAPPPSAGAHLMCTALINHIRGLLSELGIVLPLNAATVRRQAPQYLGGLPGRCHTAVGDMLSELSHLDEYCGPCSAFATTIE